MPDILPNIDNEPAQGIQALLDTVYLWNQDVANGLIDKINELLEELGELSNISGVIKPYNELEAPVRQYSPMYYGNGVYVASTMIDVLPTEPDMSKWILIATKGSTFVAGSGIDITENVISVEQEIIHGASAGSTAVQPGDLATVATTGSYDDLSDKPVIQAVGAGTITVKQGGVTKATFNVNQDSDTEVDLDQGSDVESVNGKTGVVVLNATDIHALADSTKYAASLAFTVDPTTFVVTAQLKDQDNNNLGTAQTIDLPLESVVVSGAYDSVTKEVVLTLENGSTVRFSVADLVSGLQTEITSTNKLDADLVDDTTSANKFVTASEKSAIATAVQPSDLATVATSGSYNDLLNKPTIPDTTHMVTDNTAQNISAAKTFVAANPSTTTAQTTVANYAVKFGTSDNNDLFSISADTNTNTLSIVGDNASNVIDIAASGAVLNHFQVSSSDVTFGGNSLINPDVMTGADGTNAGTSGLVPAPAATDNNKFLAGDGTWKTVVGGVTSVNGQTGAVVLTIPTITFRTWGANE